MRVRIGRVVGLLLVVGLVVVAVPRSSRARQLGNIDNCEEFYRYAKGHLHVFYSGLNQEELVKQSAAWRYDPVEAGAYAQLYVACVTRNREVGR